jgi:penicillin-binding protein 1A
LPEGLLSEGGNLYFKEFPAAESVKRLGDPNQDSLGDFLNNLGGNRGGSGRRPDPGG